MSSPEPRIGDAEREAAIGALGEHYAAGRITKEEYDERADTAWSARTAVHLRPLFADLPPIHAAGGPGAPTGPGSEHPVGRALSPGLPGLPGRWGRVPMLPHLLVVVAIVLLVSGTLFPVLLVAVGLWWGARAFHPGHQGRQGRLGRPGGHGSDDHRGCPQSSGSERAERGRWA